MRLLMSNIQKIFFAKNYSAYSLSITACLLFGLAHLTLVLTSGDGGWFLEAKELIAGKRLYSDFGSVLQPVFPLLTELQIKVLGNSFIAQRIFYAGSFLFYLHALSLLVGLTTIDDVVKGILYAALFFMGIHYNSIRFDDYHVLANTLVMYAIYLAYFYARGESGKFHLIAFGMLSSTAFFIRINQGAALIAAIGLMLLLSEKKILDKLREILIVASTSLLVFFLVLYLADESPLSWLEHTIIKASAAKGGARLVMQPYNIFLQSLQFIADSIRFDLKPGTAGAALAVALSIYANQFNKLKSKRLIAYGLVVCGGYFLFWVVVRDQLILDSAPFWLVLTYLIFAIFMIGILTRKLLVNVIGAPIVLARITENSSIFSFFRQDTTVLFAFPFFLYVFSSLSSGGFFDCWLFECSMAVFVCVIAFPSIFSELFIFYLILVAITGFFLKFYTPYSWYSYWSPPLNSETIEYKNWNKLGPHFIDHNLFALVKPVCDIVKPDNEPLLSLPYSFANYYCDIPIWKGYVQSFFDTSSVENIHQLIEDLKQSPPPYIFYQRQLANMRQNEIRFNGGNPLPHRKLDDLIMENLADHVWTEVYENKTNEDVTWYLIKTGK